MSESSAGLMPCDAAVIQSVRVWLPLSLEQPEAPAATTGLPLVLPQPRCRPVTTQQEAPALEQKRNKVRVSLSPRE